MSDPPAASRKYSTLECERRFLLDEVPAGVLQPRAITDKYLTGTNLRLRLVDEDGQRMHKLGQKLRSDIDDPREVHHTTMYLSAHEFAVLEGLPGSRLSKVRSIVRFGDIDVAVDEFTGSLHGLLLAEVDLGSRAVVDAFVPPAWCGAEVTLDERFCGAALAETSLSELERVVAELRASSS